VPRNNQEPSPTRGRLVTVYYPGMSLSRSEQMSRIRSRDTGPELLLRRALRARGHRYRLHANTPAGRPDIVFVEKRVAVFVDGCQWHGCPMHYVAPRSRREFWSRKLAENVMRDCRQTAALETVGWKVVRAWEHEVFEQLEAVAGSVERALGSATWQPPMAMRVVEVGAAEGPTENERRRLIELRGRSPCRCETRRRSTSKWKRSRAHQH
jgi:DNA mismatch endonuclease (patch repair protein)